MKLKYALLLSAISLTLTACGGSSDDNPKPPIVVADTTPDSFSFTAVEYAPLNEWIESETITVSGINTTTSISIENGEYRIDEREFTSEAGTIENGQNVQIRVKSKAYGEQSEVTLDIGGISAVFTVTAKLKRKVVFFAEEERYGNELRETDLTPQGAKIVEDLNTIDITFDYGNYFKSLIHIGDELLYLKNGAVNRVDLKTFEEKEVKDSDCNILELHGALVFCITDGGYYRVHLSKNELVDYRSNGWSHPTGMVDGWSSKLRGGFNNTAFFEYWAPQEDIEASAVTYTEGSPIEQLIYTGPHVYFHFTDDKAFLWGPTSHGLVRTDGTADGTYVFQLDGDLLSPDYVISFKEKVYFSIFRGRIYSIEGNSIVPIQNIAVRDGAMATTKSLIYAAAGYSSYSLKSYDPILNTVTNYTLTSEEEISNIVASNDFIVFKQGNQLKAIKDGTTVVITLADSIDGFSEFFIVDDFAYFTLVDETSGELILRRTNGTHEGTVTISGLTGDIDSVYAGHDRLFLKADHPQYGRQLWFVANHEMSATWVELASFSAGNTQSFSGDVSVTNDHLILSSKKGIWRKSNQDSHKLEKFYDFTEQGQSYCGVKGITSKNVYYCHSREEGSSLWLTDGETVKEIADIPNNLYVMEHQVLFSDQRIYDEVSETFLDVSFEGDGLSDDYHIDKTFSRDNKAFYQLDITNAVTQESSSQVWQVLHDGKLKYLNTVDKRIELSNIVGSKSFYLTRENDWYEPDLYTFGTGNGVWVLDTTNNTMEKLIGIGSRGEALYYYSGDYYSNKFAKLSDNTLLMVFNKRGKGCTTYCPPSELVLVNIEDQSLVKEQEIQFDVNHIAQLNDQIILFTDVGFYRISPEGELTQISEKGVSKPFVSSTIVGNELVFSIDNELWKTDGTTAGTVLLESKYSAIRSEILELSF